MESSAARGGPLSVSSPSPQPPRKEWRAISNNEGSEPVERRIAERRGPLDGDFCSIMIDGGGGLSDEILQQRIQEISRQREELQHVEIELRAQSIVMNEILEVQNSFQTQIREHADAASKLKEKLEEREKHIRELEMKLEEKERELRAIKLDYEAAWAKDDLLREQNKELATFRRERDNSEAERAQHLKQIHDLQEHIQDKESQIRALEEQHRVAQQNILYKEDQMREAQAYISRCQVDAFQSTTLQAELRDRTEQFNQYWMGLHRQFAEVEQHHLQTIRQLQLELAEVRERSGIHSEGAKVSHQSSEDSSSYAENNMIQTNANNITGSNGNLCFMTNGNLDAHPSYVASSSSSAKDEQAAGITIAPSPILGINTFLPPNQMTALTPYVVHPQAIPQSVTSSSSHIPESQIGHFQPIPSHQHWQTQQAVADVSQNPSQNNYQPSQVEQQTLLRSDAHYSYEIPSERKVIHPDQSNTHIEQRQRSGTVISGTSNEDEVVLESNGEQYQTSPGLKETSNANTTLHATVGYAQPEQSEVKNQSTVCAISQSQSQEQVLASGQQWSAPISKLPAAPNQPIFPISVVECDEKVVMFPESTLKVNTTAPAVPAKAMEPTLLDERSLLACIVRAIPAGADGRIRISTTLPNRLGKMLAPLHWHDYKKQYGKLDEFVVHHPELFVIEGDFIRLREGAQESISATTAFAKVAAVAASPSPYPSLFPSVALTPVAQNHRQKMVPSVDSSDKRLQLQMSKPESQQPNGVNFNIARGISDMSISARSKIPQEVNGVPCEIRPAHSSVQNSVGNGANKVYSNGRLSSVGKQARSAGAGVISRR